MKGFLTDKFWRWRGDLAQRHGAAAATNSAVPSHTFRTRPRDRGLHGPRHPGVFTRKSGRATTFNSGLDKRKDGFRSVGAPGVGSGAWDSRPLPIGVRATERGLQSSREPWQTTLTPNTHLTSGRTRRPCRCNDAYFLGTSGALPQDAYLRTQRTQSGPQSPACWPPSLFAEFEVVLLTRSERAKWRGGISARTTTRSVRADNRAEDTGRPSAAADFASNRMSMKRGRNIPEVSRCFRADQAGPGECGLPETLPNCRFDG